MSRWYFLLENMENGTIEGISVVKHSDIVYAFFQNCYHLRDWVVHDHLKSDIEVKAFVERIEWMKICHDICNGGKHFLLGKSKGESDIEETPRFRQIENGNVKEIRFNFTIADQRSILPIEYTPLSLATECMKAWNNFLGTATNSKRADDK
jgi:hypothetical protein